MDFTKTEYKSLSMFCKNIKLIHNKKKGNLFNIYWGKMWCPQ